jgi:hypothetical protein
MLYVTPELTLAVAKEYSEFTPITAQGKAKEEPPTSLKVTFDVFEVFVVMVTFLYDAASGVNNTPPNICCTGASVIMEASLSSLEPRIDVNCATSTGWVV